MADSESGISGNSNLFGGVYYQPMDKNSLPLGSHLLVELKRDLVNLNRGRPRGTGGKFKSVSRPDAQTGPHCEPNISNPRVRIVNYQRKDLVVLHCFMGNLYIQERFDARRRQHHTGTSKLHVQ